MTQQGAFRIYEHGVLSTPPIENLVSIVVDGVPIEASAGEPVAVAMLSHGIRRFHTMPESGSPRGYFCGVGRCTDCLMVVDGELNVRTCVTPAREGMIVETQHGLGEWKASTS